MVILLLYLWGGTTQGGAIVVFFLVLVFEGMIQLVVKMQRQSMVNEVSRYFGYDINWQVGICCFSNY